MIIHNKFIFAHMGKNAGHFVNYWVREAIPGCKFMPNNHHPLADIDELENRFKWGIIRNPYDFYVSWWASTRKRSGSVSELVGGNKEEDFGEFLKYTLEKSGEILHSWIDFNIMNRLDIGLNTFLFIRAHCDYKKVFEIKKIENLKKYLLTNKIIRCEGLAKNIEKLFAENIFRLNEQQTETLYRLENKLKTNQKTREFNHFEHGHFKTYYKPGLIELVNYKDRYLFQLYPDYLWRN